MSQRTALQQLDATIMGKMLGAGLADAAEYLASDAAPGVDPTPCNVLVDRDVQMYGDDVAEVAAPKTLITLFLAQVAAPVRASVVTINPGTPAAESFKLDAQTKRDESLSRWVVSNV